MKLISAAQNGISNNLEYPHRRTPRLDFAKLDDSQNALGTSARGIVKTNNSADLR